MKKLLKIISLIMVLTFVFGACSNNVFTTSSGKDDKTTVGTNAEGAADSGANGASGSADKVKFTMQNGGSFIIKLYPQYAPETVENFVQLVSAGFYDGLTFHRVVDGFMAHGGDPQGTGNGGSAKTITGEFSANGHLTNSLSHTRGVISMARSSSYDSASSQFFICYGDASFLDGQYAAFGEVVEGMEVVDAFLEVERQYNSMGELAKPVEPIVIEKAEVI